MLLHVSCCCCWWWWLYDNISYFVFLVFFRKVIKPVVKIEPKYEIVKNKVMIIIIVQSAVAPTYNWAFGSTKITKTSSRYSMTCTQQSEGTYQLAMEVKEVSIIILFIIIIFIITWGFCCSEKKWYWNLKLHWSFITLDWLDRLVILKKESKQD